MKDNIYFWHGNPFLLKEKEDYWKSNFIEKNGDINLEVFDGNEIWVKDIINSISALAFMWDKRIIFIKNIPPQVSDKKMNEKSVEVLLHWLSKFPKSSIVIFISSKPDKRTKIYKEIIKISKVEDLSISDMKIGSWAKDYVKRRWINISTDLINKLIDLTWFDLFKISNELRKLSIYRNWAEIRQEDLVALTSNTSEVNIFKITNLIASWKKSEALNELKEIIRWGEDIVYVFNLIVRQVRLLLLVFEIKDKDSSFIARELKIAPFIASSLKSQVKNFTLEKLLKMHKNIYNIDKGFKTWKIKWNMGLALEIERGVILL